MKILLRIRLIDLLAIFCLIKSCRFFLLLSHMSNNFQIKKNIISYHLFYFIIKIKTIFIKVYF